MECSICYCILAKPLVTDPCGHIFCQECFARIKNKCSVCNHNVVKTIRVYGNFSQAQMDENLTQTIGSMQETMNKLSELTLQSQKELVILTDKKITLFEEYQELEKSIPQLKEKIREEVRKELEKETKEIQEKNQKTLRFRDNSIELIKKLNSEIKDLTTSRTDIKYNIKILQEELETLRSPECKKLIIEGYKNEANEVIKRISTGFFIEKLRIEEQIKLACGGYRDFSECAIFIENIKKFKSLLERKKIKRLSKEAKEVFDEIIEFSTEENLV